MKTTSLAALVLGLSMVGAPAFAADYDQGRDRDRDRNQPAAGQQQDQNTQGDRKGDRRDGARRDRTPPSGMHKSDWNNNNNNNNNNQNDGDRSRNRDRDNNNYNNNNNNRRDNKWNNDRRRSGFNWTQYRRNMKAAQRFRAGIYHGPRGYSYRRWHYGERLPIGFYARDYWLLDFIVYGLFAPPPGTVWVRYGDDALLIDTETGEIIQVRYDVFYS